MEACRYPVVKVAVVGLALDYGVKETALEAARLWLKTTVVRNRSPSHKPCPAASSPWGIGLWLTVTTERPEHDIQQFASHS